MKLNKLKNENYAAVVVEIKTIIPLEKCDNVQAAIIMGNQVVVSKDVKVGDIEAYKAKSERFYARETAQLDKGELNIEDEN